MTPKPWTPPGEGWIEHRPGDPCPVDGLQRVAVLFRLSRDSKDARDIPEEKACYVSWGDHAGKSYEVVAYRIVKSREELEAENAALRAQLGRIACYSLSSPREFTERERLSDLARRAYELVGIAAQALHIGETK